MLNTFSCVYVCSCFITHKTEVKVFYVLKFRNFSSTNFIACMYVCMLVVRLFEAVLYFASQGILETHDIAPADSKLAAILQPQSPKYWDHRHEAACLTILLLLN